MIIRRIAPMSAAKVGGVLYALLGLVTGAIFTLISFTGVAAAAGMGAYGMLFGVGAILILPICYGILGFIVVGISTAFFNVAARFAGGLVVEAE
ncbi:MAG TPA: hypothetical protein VFU23_15865 [Gemmatimonadales bacterium]|nr:hypothetical protein [Gemmatimonadales bacterium]